MSRKPLIAGNWKMNLNHFEAIALVQKIAFSLPDKYFDKVDVTVIPPFTDLRSVQTLVDGDKLRLTYGAQDVSQHDSGAYTGEISGAFLAKLGLHVRRRRALRAAHLSRRGRRAGRRQGRRGAQTRPDPDRLHRRGAGDPRGRRPRRVQRRAAAGLAGRVVGRADRRQVVIAYEPVWAIGTGRVASAADAQEVCAAIRDELAELATACRSPRGCGCSTAARSTPRTSARSSVRRTSTARWSGGASLDGEQFAMLSAIAAGGPLPEPVQPVQRHGRFGHPRSRRTTGSLAAMELALQITLVVTSLW